MDPNETLAQLRRIVARTLASDADGDRARMAELFDALDTWIEGGGFLPRRWADTKADLRRD